jgi:hypothetical protein
MGDSTAVFLELKWDVQAADPEDKGTPDWLTTAKLTELGFDCEVPVTSPVAREHYSSQAPLRTYLVLEYEGDAWKSAQRDGNLATHLFAVDAGRDPRRLREKYPDTGRYLITHGLVRISLRRHSSRDGTPLVPPRLRGRIETVLPHQIFVPRPHGKMLVALHRRTDRTDDEPVKEPRFAATVSWGSRYEPWVQGVRLLSESSRPVKPPG